MKKQNQAFTLVELIVVITILAILGTIAIMAFSGYSKNARDSARIADIGNMKKSLELWILQSGNYPEPTNGTVVTYSGTTVWIQGTFGDSVTQTVGKLEKKPVDPLYNNEYTYSVTNSKKEYQIGAVLEKDMVYNNPVFAQANAAGIGEAYISGTYNGILTTVGTNPTYILALPSIILSDITDAEIIGTTSKLVYEGKTNLPSSYKVTGLTMTGTEFSFTPTVVWSGSSITNLNNQSEFQNLVGNLQTIYKTDSNFSSLPEYTSIVSESTITPVVMAFTKGIIEDNTAQELTNVKIDTILSNCNQSTKPTDNGHISYTENPTTVNQSYIQNSSECGYICLDGYTGLNCSTTPGFLGDGSNLSPWIKGDNTALESCNAYNTQVTYKNNGQSRGSGTCGNGSQECLTNGMYYIAPDGNQANKFPAYCDMDRQGGGWTLMVLSGMGYGKTSTFWDGTLNSNTNLSYTGYTINTGDVEKIIKNLSFTDILLNYTQDRIYRSASNSTFKAKKDAQTSWTNVLGNLGTLTWNLNDSDGYTNGDFLLGINFGVAGYGDYNYFFIGGTSYPSSWANYYGTKFIELTNTVDCYNWEWCTYGSYTSNFAIGYNSHRYVIASIDTVNPFTLFVK